MTRGRANPPLTTELVASMTSQQPDGCWLWTGRISNYGYPLYDFGGSGKKVRVHRWVSEQAEGPIPEGWTVDHQCHDPAVCLLNNECPHRRCVNPEHLKQMTNADNSLRGGSLVAANARKTHCKRGHPLSGKNLYERPDGRGRDCRTCRAETMRALYLARAH